MTAPDESIPLAEGGEPLILDSRRGLAVGEIEIDGGDLVQGANAFSLALTPTDDGSSAELVAAAAFMPAHGHGTSTPTISESSVGYRVEELDLFMPGRWDITLDILVADEPDDFEFTVNVR